ncbi:MULTISPECIES: hypothetical protein [unclassified Vibrio]|uniref:hypothetical protein n=1 Tax=unclassified Vibrio TaxID=2614977 RepID=UPI001269396C|nr:MULTISPECIES: hypothetical protein [unclassified Vibrio]QFT37709.1 hypothetical protein FIU99_14950 [Vibrio sp. THAF64]QGM35612.1 hypothetical protein GGC04_14960 [Vibrio sp. THAF191d]QGN71112.1 hypothetical protein GGC03_14955 [Vibrio sp. THAF191c]
MTLAATAILLIISLVLNGIQSSLPILELFAFAFLHSELHLRVYAKGKRMVRFGTISDVENEEQEVNHFATVYASVALTLVFVIFKLAQ